MKADAGTRNLFLGLFFSGAALLIFAICLYAFSVSPGAAIQAIVDSFARIREELFLSLWQTL